VIGEDGSFKSIGRKRISIATSKNIKQFLGFARYYRRFISNLSKIVKPLMNFLKKNEKSCWNEVQDKVFMP